MTLSSPTLKCSGTRIRTFGEMIGFAIRPTSGSLSLYGQCARHSREGPQRSARAWIHPRLYTVLKRHRAPGRRAPRPGRVVVHRLPSRSAEQGSKTFLLLTTVCADVESLHALDQRSGFFDNPRLGALDVHVHEINAVERPQER